MKIYLDESGTFTTDKRNQLHSLSCNVALVVPEKIETELFVFFEQWKTQLKLDDKGEAKGHKLNEEDFEKLLSGLSKFDILIEVDVIDLGNTSDEEIKEHQLKMAEQHPKSKTGSNTNAEQSKDIVADLSLPEYVQILSTSNVIYNVLSTAITYYAQRFPKELGNFQWIFDAKNPTKKKDYEKTLPYLVKPLVQTSFLSQPIASVIGFDYSYLTTYHLQEGYVIEEQKINSLKKSEFVHICKIMQDIHFVPSDTNMGLQIVDILANCVRRAMSDRLQFRGWRYLSSLIIKRHESSVSVTRFGGCLEEKPHTPLANFVNYFQAHGKQMLVPNELTGKGELKKGYIRWSYLEKIPTDTMVKKMTIELY